MRKLFICTEQLNSENTSVCQDMATLTSVQRSSYSWTSEHSSAQILLPFSSLNKIKKSCWQRVLQHCVRGKFVLVLPSDQTSPSRKFQKLFKAHQQRRWWEGGFLSPDHSSGISHKKGWNVAASHSVFLTQCMRMWFNILILTCANNQLCWLRDGLSSPALFNCPLHLKAGT